MLRHITALSTLRQNDTLFAIMTRLYYDI